MEELHARLPIGSTYILMVLAADTGAIRFYERYGLLRERTVDAVEHYSENMGFHAADQPRCSPHHAVSLLGSKGKRLFLNTLDRFLFTPGISGCGRQSRRCANIHHPGLESADEIGGTFKSEFAEGCRCEAGAVAPVADDDDAAVGVGHLRNVVGAGGVQSPFEDVSVDDQRAWEFAVALSLLDWACVNHQGAGGDLGRQVGWLHPIKTLAGSFEE